MLDIAFIIGEAWAWLQANSSLVIGCLSGLGLLWVLRAFGLVGPVRYVNESDTPPRSGGASYDDCGDDGGD
jgi:hypothetical protein